MKGKKNENEIIRMHKNMEKMKILKDLLKKYWIKEGKYNNTMLK